MSAPTTITINSSSWARVTRERDEAREQLRAARDRAWKLARERNHWKLDCLEQCKLLAMSADREEKLRVALRGLLVFAEEDQEFASPAYQKAFRRAQEALT